MPEPQPDEERGVAFVRNSKKLNRICRRQRCNNVLQPLLRLFICVIRGIRGSVVGAYRAQKDYRHGGRRYQDRVGVR